MKKFIYAALVLCISSYYSYAQVTLLKDVNVYPYMVELNNHLVFFGDTGVVGGYTWSSDGTPAGTQVISQPHTYVLGPSFWGTQAGNQTYSPVVFNNYVYYLANDSIHGVEIWKSDGTAGGTSLLKDIWPGINGYVQPELFWPYFCGLNNELYFSANDGTGFELWKSDGTGAGTQLVKKIAHNTTVGSFPSHITAFNNSLFFTASNDTDGVQLYISDGTTPGTHLFTKITKGLKGAFNDGMGETTNPNFTISGSNLFFIAYKDTSPGFQYLYRTDGTVPGTILLNDSITNISGLTDVNGTLYYYSNYPFNKNPSNLFKSDGTPVGTVAINTNGIICQSAASLFSFNGKLYFLGSNTTLTAYGLCVTDGTPAGTFMVYQMAFCQGCTTPDIKNYTANGNSFFFHGEFLVPNYATDTRVIQSNGAASGNKIYWGGINAFPGETMYNGDYFFRGYDSTDITQHFRIYKISPDVLPSGVKNVDIPNAGISVYPVPFANETSLEFSTPTDNDIDYTLYDVTGRQVQNAIIHKGSMNKVIERDGLPSGIYFYRLMTGGELIGSGKIMAE